MVTGKRAARKAKKKEKKAKDKGDDDAPKRKGDAADEALLPAFHVLRQLQVIGWLHPRIDAILGRMRLRSTGMAIPV